jgi:signal transduction histidine kinase
MKSPIIAFIGYAEPVYHPFLLNTNTDNANLYITRAAETLNNQTGQFVFTLAQELRNPLGHISLSVEMLEFIIEDNDLKMYLEVIKRNSIRINDLINEFLIYQQT